MNPQPETGSSLRRVLIPLGATLLLLSALIPDLAAVASDLDGSTDSYRGWKIRSFELRGLRGTLAEPLERGLALSGSGRRIFAERPTFRRRALEEDLLRVELWLASQGYPHSRVDARIVPHRRGRTLDLALEIELGPPVLVDSISVTGLTAGTRLPVPSPLHVRRNERFIDDSVRASEIALRDWLLSIGHAEAATETEIEWIDSTHVALVFSTRPGAVYTFDSIEISGAPHDLVPLVRRIVDLEPGTRYSPRHLERTQEGLRLLDLFRRIRVTSDEPSGDGTATRAIDVEVVPRDFRTVEFGIGYWTDDQLRTRALWKHRNLLGGGRGAQVQGSYSRFLQDIGASVWWPALPLPRARTSLSAEFESQDEESFDLQETALELIVAYRYSVRTTVHAGFALSRVDLESKTTQEPGDPSPDLGGNLLTATAAWNREQTDDRFYPTTGSVTSAKIEWIPPGFASEAHYFKAESAGSLYLGLKSAMVIALRLSAGYAVPMRGETELPVNERFFAGGAASMRGFKRHRLGPRDDTGTPLGGEALLLAGIELRFPLFWKLRGALFADVGQVWRHVEALDFDTFEVAVGPGLMFVTPIGPVRGDVGFRVSDFSPEEPEAVLHIAIGHPF